MDEIPSYLPKAVLAELNAFRPFAEFPKMLHGADGKTLIVASAEEEAAAGDGWYATPDDAAAAPAKKGK